MKTPCDFCKHDGNVNVCGFCDSHERFEERDEAIADIKAQSERIDLATLEHLLQCSCGGWLEVSPRYGEVVCHNCDRLVRFKGSPAAAVMALHREHGGER